MAAKPTINLSTDGGTVVGTTQLDGSQQINLVAGTGIILTGTSPDSITIQSTGGGGGGSVTAVTTTLSGITITNPTTTPEISGTLGVSVQHLRCKPVGNFRDCILWVRRGERL